MEKIKELIRSLVPKNILLKISDVKFRYQLNKVSKNHLNEINRLKRKQRINVLFLILNPAVWKYDQLYKIFRDNAKYDPLILICPNIHQDKNEMIKQMKSAYEYFVERDYNVLLSYDETNDSWLDIREEINPDLLFFGTPYELTHPKHYIQEFLDKLTCYVPYTFQTNYKTDMHYDQFFQNVLWRAFYQTSIHKEIAEKEARNNARNVVVTGYPGLDGLLFKSEENNSLEKEKKHLIWAPHHTIEEFGTNLNFSNFNILCDYFINIAKEYKDQLFITFKPHPLLKKRLYKSISWGKKKTDEYYSFWENNKFCGINDGNYKDLFLESDAMVHDCDSFMAEYICMNKPSLYTMKDENVTERMNQFGQMLLGVHYHATKPEDIDDFISRVVLQGNDYLEADRKTLIEKYLIPPNGQSASMNIFDEIDKHLT